MSRACVQRLEVLRNILTDCALVIAHGLGRHAATLEIPDLVIVLKVNSIARTTRYTVF